jgi:D-mannonate dehydratase
MARRGVFFARDGYLHQSHVGYPYMLMPDHVPQIDGRDPSGVAFAYCYGYIQALLDALANARA